MKSTPFAVRIHQVQHLQIPTIAEICLFYDTRLPGGKEVRAIELVHRDDAPVRDGTLTSTPSNPDLDLALHNKAEQLCNFI